MLYNKIYRRFQSVDIPLLLCAFTLCAISLYSLYMLGRGNYSNMLTSGFSRRSALMQAISVLAGLLIFILIPALGQRVIKKLSPAAFVLSLGLTALTLTPLGITVDDDKAWLSLFGVSVQPSELLKVCFIMCSALILSSELNKGRKYMLFALCAISGAALIFLQRDMGTFLIFALIALGMLFCSGVSKKLWAIGVLVSPAVFYGVWRFIFNDDQRARILSAVDPSLDPYGIGFQQISARNAIAGGGFTGRLFRQRGSFVYVSSAHNDFLLSFIAQLFGSIGIFAVCLLLSLLIARAAPKRNDTGYIYYLKSGAFIMFGSQAIINTAMNLSVFPVVGIPLPFISAGGTAIISAFAMLGLISVSDEASPVKGII